MITQLIKDDKPFSQETYDYYIKNTPSYKYKCPNCKHSGCMIKHAYYTRIIKIGPDVIKIRILRLKCKECGKTHAVLLCFFVPYSQVPLSTHVEIITADENEISKIIDNHPSIDESNIKYIKKQYDHHWKERMICGNIRFDDSLIINCFSNYSKQFMQCRNTSNLLYTSTHTA